MRSAPVAARYEWRRSRFDFTQRLEYVFPAGNLRRIRFRSDEHEVVVHHRQSFDAIALGDELLLRRFCMNEDDIRIATPPHVERLPRAEGHDPNFDAGLLLK